FADDSTISVERRSDDGKWQAVGEPEAAAWPAASRVTVVSDADRDGRAAAPVPPAHEEAARPQPASQPIPPTVQPPAPAAPYPAAPPAPAAAQHAVARHNARIRVDATQLDDLVGMAGELAVLSDNLMGLRELGGTERWLHALESLQRVSREIRDTTLDLRMVPVDELFSRFPRVVRDLADRSGKQIDLRSLGQEARFDR